MYLEIIIKINTSLPLLNLLSFLLFSCQYLCIGKGCTNRHLKDEGGCTIWYDEPSCLKGVEARLHQEIPELSSSFELPVELASSGVVYG